MTTGVLKVEVEEGGAQRAWWRRVNWAGVLCGLILILMVVDRGVYLMRFGWVYTEPDQGTLWNQAEDISRGIFREPCFYGQSYNVPIEAWGAAPLLWVGVPAWAALPLVSTAMGLAAFWVLAWWAYRHGQRWAAAMVLMLPLALPIEYTVVSSLPRGFVTGVAVGSVGVALWMWGKTGRAYFWAGLVSVLAVTVNPSCGIILLAGGVYALLVHWKEWRFYVWTAVGMAAALPLPLLIWWFYRAYPSHDAYHAKVPFTFSWELLQQTLWLPKSWHWNGLRLDRFFGDFVPVVKRGWWMVVILGSVEVMLLMVRRWRAAAAFLVAGVFAMGCLGIERVHSMLSHVFYSGSRMFLALPVLVGMGVVWMDGGAAAVFRKWRVVPMILRGVVIIGLGVLALERNWKLIGEKSPLVVNTFPLAVERVADLQRDAALVARICKERGVTLVLPGSSQQTCFGVVGPVLSGHGFETMSPEFERRTWRIAEERVKVHKAVLLYKPTWRQTMGAMGTFPGSQQLPMGKGEPDLLLVVLPGEGMTGMEVAEAIGMRYREKF